MKGEKRVFQLTTKELTDTVKNAVAIGIAEYVKLLGNFADIKSTALNIEMQKNQPESEIKPWNTCDHPKCNFPVKKGDIYCGFHAKKIKPRKYMRGKPKKKRTVNDQSDNYLSIPAAHRKLTSEGYKISMSYIYTLVKNEKINGYGTRSNLVDPEQVKKYCVYSAGSKQK